MTISQAIKKRSSKRSFLPKKINKDIQEKILKTAGMTPSGANMQPWIVYAVSNEDTLQKIGNAIIDRMQETDNSDITQHIQYYPVKWINPYKKRRLETGAGLYSLMEVDRKDIQTRTKMWHDNFRWFGAKTVFFVFTNKALIDNAQGVLLDCGAYMQSIMLAAQEYGIDSCPQGSTTEYGKIVSKVLDVPDNLALLYSVVLGYADTDAKINSYQPKRASLEDVVTFVE